MADRLNVPTWALYPIGLIICLTLGPIGLSITLYNTPRNLKNIWRAARVRRVFMIVRELALCTHEEVLAQDAEAHWCCHCGAYRLDDGSWETTCLQDAAIGLMPHKEPQVEEPPPEDPPMPPGPPAWAP
jgi:hypothetical protein